MKRPGGLNEKLRCFTLISAIVTIVFYVVVVKLMGCEPPRNKERKDNCSLIIDFLA